jgi:hypothetical protein
LPTRLAPDLSVTSTSASSGAATNEKTTAMTNELRYLIVPFLNRFSIRSAPAATNFSRLRLSLV